MLALIWLVLGIAMVAVPVWLGWTRWPAILNGHPAMLIAGIACGLAGLIAVAWAIGSLTIGGRLDREGDPEHPAHRTSTQVRAAVRSGGSSLPFRSWFFPFSLSLALAYARPFVATPTAVTALRSENGVRLSDRLGWYELVPARQDAAGEDIKPTTGLVFVPGARVDSRAYARVLRPLAEAGYLVAVLEGAVRLCDYSMLIMARRSSIVHPEITHWVVGGHSLGGTMAASLADNDERVNGLVLFASYPAEPMDP